MGINLRNKVHNDCYAGECLEYIVVHEMVHLLEPTHNVNFVCLMDRFMPQWR